MSDILHRVGIDAKPEQVFNALTTINGLQGWWSSTAAGNAAMGGIINYGFCDMQVIAAEPDKLVHWRCTGGPDEWLNTEVIFQLDWKEDQTFVLFNLETAIGRAKVRVHRSAGLGATTLNGCSIQGRSNNAMRDEGRVIWLVAA